MAEKNNIAERSRDMLKSDFDRQDTLLVLCARLNLSSKEHQEIERILIDGVDWDVLIQKANWHRLSALVAHHLLTFNSNGLIPKDTFEKMHSVSYSNLARNMILQDELSRLLIEFKNQEIPVIVLKGAAMLDNIFRDISLRQMSDLDILVRPEHLGQAEAIAFKKGYKYGFAVDYDSAEQTIEKRRHLANLWHREKHIMLEIHHNIVSPDEPYQFDLDDFWKRAISINLSGAKALVFAPEDNLIHLCINFLSDRRYQSSKALGQLCDISELIKYYRETLDWDLASKVAHVHGLSSMVHLALYACEQLFDTPVPSGVLDKFRPKEFNIALADLFIKRRVLDMRPWLAHGLADSNIHRSQLGTYRAIIVRFFNLVKDIFKKNKLGTQRGHMGLRRIGYILLRLAQGLLKPSELKNDLKLDRWLHDIYNVN
jgi:hypothetical protein